MEVQTILSTVLLTFQLSLGLWQIGKLTPVGGLVKGGLGWLLSFLPFRRSSAYALLQRYEGRVFKRVKCAVLTKAAGSQDELVAIPSRITLDTCDIIQSSYLGNDFTLARRDGNKLFINDKMSYYITDAIWENLKILQFLSVNDVVFVKGYKEFWEFIITGGLMTFSEVLDSVILDNMYIISSDSTLLLPVNLSVSEEKVLKFLNMVGLFLQKKKLHWLFPFLFSLTSAVLEYSAPLRVWLYGKINVLFCSAVRLICDKLSYPMRREVYSLGNWVDKLQPSNDFELRVVRGDRCVPLAGGAKLVNQNGATLLPHPYSFSGEEQEGLLSEEAPEGIPFTMTRTKFFRCHHFDIGCQYRPLDNPEGSGIAYITDYPRNPNAPHNPERHIFILQVECNRDEYIKMCTLVSCMAKNRSGSLKLYDPNSKVVQVYGMKESIIHYAKSGFPPVYEIQFKDVILT